MTMVTAVITRRKMKSWMTIIVEDLRMKEKLS